jgi:ABC-2 type transport system permease protein
VSHLLAALRVELLKSRRSRVPWFLAVAFSLVPLVGGLFMVIVKNPEQAQSLGLLGAKAQLAAVSADWPGYLRILAEGIGVGGIVLFAFLTTWSFGREFADRTVRCILALPTPRWAIVIAKLIVVAAWCAVIAAWAMALGFVVGAAVGLPGWSGDLAAETAGRIVLGVGVAMALQSATAFVASAGRGYMPAFGFVVAVMAIAQILRALGWAAWFPWAVPMLVVVTGDPSLEAASLASMVMVLLAAFASLGATLMWWQRADQTG